MKYIKFGEKKNGRYLKAEELTIPQFKKNICLELYQID